ncbi:MAG: hypothetical protein ACE5LC_06070 [Candidatus Aminicenantales bacterium]
MRKLIVLSTVLLFTLSFLPLLAKEVDVSGKWELTIETPRGEVTREVTFEQDGENLTVTMAGPRGEVKGEGKIKENRIEWTITRSTPQGEMTMTYTGTVEGDKMRGEVQIGEWASREWTAKRK